MHDPVQQSELFSSLAKVQKIDTKKLARTIELGELSFAPAMPAVEKSLYLFNTLSTDALCRLPGHYQWTVIHAAKALISYADEIRAYSSFQQEPARKREELISQSEAINSYIENELVKIIAIINSMRVEFETISRKINDFFQSTQADTASISRQIEADSAEARRVLADIRAASAEQGVTFQATYFKTEAEMQEKLSRQWGFTTAICIFCFVLSAAWNVLLQEGHKATTNLELIQYSTGKLVFFGTIAYATFLCGKNFLAHKHNRIINMHRHNALMSYRALVDATKGEDKRDIVLTYASACMFTPQETGFSKPPSEGSAINLLQLLPKASLDKG